jgi:hypothetical protein
MMWHNGIIYGQDTCHSNAEVRLDVGKMFGVLALISVTEDKHKMGTVHKCMINENKDHGVVHTHRIRKIFG